MKNIRHIVLYCLVTVSLAICSKSLVAQDLIMHQMDRLPQVIEGNPAYTPYSRIFVEIVSFKANLANSGFVYSDAVKMENNKAKTLTIDPASIYSAMADRNYLTTNLGVSLLSFGFKAKKMYFTYNFSANVDTRVGYAKDLLTILTKGNIDYNGLKPISWDFSGFNVNAMVYREMAFGVSREINSNLRVGVRLKFLRGAANFSTDRSDMYIVTKGIADSIIMRADYVFKASGPINLVHKVPKDIKSELTEVNADDYKKDIMGDYIFNKNKGLAIDIGATYTMDKWLFSAALTDIGRIKWRDNLHTVYAHSYYVFRGIDLTAKDGKFPDAGNMGDSLVTGFTDAFKYNELSSSPYTTWLTGKFNLAANYELHKRISLGVLNRNLLYDGRIHPQFAINACVNPFKFLTANFNYSIMNRSFKNFGAGFGLRMGVVQLYMATDNLNAIFGIDKTKSANVRVGINLVMGNTPKKTEKALID